MRIIAKTPKLNRQLKQTFLFEGALAHCADEALESPQSEFAAFEAGEPVCPSEGEQTAAMFLSAGEAAAYSPNGGGSRVELNRFAAGSMFGVAAVFSDDGRPLTNVVALRPSKVLFLPRGLLCALFERDVRVAERYISFLSGRVEYLNRRIAGFTAGEAESRLAFYLQGQLGPHGDVLELACPATALSRRLDVGRASLYRAFDKLADAGAIRRNGKTITVLDREKLAAAGRRGPKAAHGPAGETPPEKQERE